MIGSMRKLKVKEFSKILNKPVNEFIRRELKELAQNSMMRTYATYLKNKKTKNQTNPNIRNVYLFFFSFEQSLNILLPNERNY